MHSAIIENSIPFMVNCQAVLIVIAQEVQLLSCSIGLPKQSVHVNYFIGSHVGFDSLCPVM